MRAEKVVSMYSRHVYLDVYSEPDQSITNESTSTLTSLYSQNTMGLEHLGTIDTQTL